MGTRLILPAVEIADAVTESSSGRLVVPGVSLPAREIEVDAGFLGELVMTAQAAAEEAYAPFSQFQVGAALVMADDPAGEVFRGCNVENSSYGGTVCAERTAIFSAAAKGFRRLRYLAVTTVATRAAPLRDRSPCGICRQVIREFADEQTLVICDSGEEGTIGEVFDIERLLPHGFCFAPPSGA